MIKRILGLIIFLVSTSMSWVIGMKILPYANYKGTTVILLKDKNNIYGPLTQAEFNKLPGNILDAGSGNFRRGSITSQPLGPIGKALGGSPKLAWVSADDLQQAMSTGSTTVKKNEMVGTVTIDPELKEFFPTGNFTGKLRIVSCNVLFQEPYENFSKKNGVNPINLKKRVESLEYILKEWAIDIYCFQEYSFSKKTEIKDDWDAVDTLLSYKFLSIDSDKQAPDRYGLRIAFDKTRYNKIAQDSGKIGHDKGWLFAIFEDKNTDEKIGIINCHLQGFGKEDEDYKIVSGVYNQHKNKADAWIICGDFNSNKADAYWPTYFDASWKEANTGKKTTARGGGSDLEERYDYMFYKDFKSLDDFAVRPKHAVVLLSHKVNQVIGDANKTKPNYTFYFSDHAYLHAVFSLPGDSEGKAVANQGLYPDQELGTGGYTPLPTGPQDAYPEGEQYTLRYSFDETGDLVFLVRGTSVKFIPLVPHDESKLNALVKFSDDVTRKLDEFAKKETKNLRVQCYKQPKPIAGYAWIDAKTLDKTFDYAMYSTASTVDINPENGARTREVFTNIIKTESVRLDSKKPTPVSKEPSVGLQKALKNLRNKLAELADTCKNMAI